MACWPDKAACLPVSPLPRSVQAALQQNTDRVIKQSRRLGHSRYLPLQCAAHLAGREGRKAGKKLEKKEKLSWFCFTTHYIQLAALDFDTRGFMSAIREATCVSLFPHFSFAGSGCRRGELLGRKVVDKGRRIWGENEIKLSWSLR